MNRYKRGEVLEDHPLSQVYDNYGASQETEFVKSFFKRNEIMAILENCGVPLPDGEIDRDFEHRINIGYSTKRADLVFSSPDDSIYYFEVMSQSYEGKWDDDHHQQLYLKSTRLSQMYDNVYSFAVAFKEFDPKYLEEFQKMDNWYAIHLRFNDDGYYPDVYGIEEKKHKNAVKNVEKEKLGIKYLEIAKTEFGYQNRRDTPMYSNYLYIGKGYDGQKYRGIEWVLSSREGRMGIKLTGALYKQEPFASIASDHEKIMNEIESRVDGVKFFRGGRGGRDMAYYFEHDKNDFSQENRDKLRKITEAFAEIYGVSDLIEVGVGDI